MFVRYISTSANRSENGIVATTARRFFARSSFEGRLVRALPGVSALVVLALGVAMTVRALPEVI